MKILFLSLLCLSAGCASVGSSSVPESAVIGEFCHSSIDAATCLDLKVDHTYSETFTGGGTLVLGPSGELPKHAPEPRGSGRWRLEQSQLVLLPTDGRKRTLNIEGVGESLVLRESIGKNSRHYRR